VDGACLRAAQAFAILWWPARLVASDCASQPARAVAQNILVSPSGPAMRIRVDDSLRYVGALRFDLRGIACVERQVFAAAETDRVRRLFIVQFESILDTSDELYRWKVRTPVPLGGVPYQHNVFAFDTRTEIREEPQAETAKTEAFLKAHGLALDAELVMSRFARVVGENRRRELIFFYMEPLPADVGRVTDFDDGAPRTPPQRALASALSERARKAFAVLEK
jgi:hypothetical protein